MMAIKPQDLNALRDWLRNRAGELMKEAIGRRESGTVMREATLAELSEANQLAERMTGRKLKRASLKDSAQYALIQCAVAEKLEAEAKQLSAWADLV